MVILWIFKRLFSTSKMKNHRMNSGMSLFMFYVFDYANESKMQTQVSNRLFIKILIIISISTNVYRPYVCDLLGLYISLVYNSIGLIKPY